MNHIQQYVIVMLYGDNNNTSQRTYSNKSATRVEYNKWVDCIWVNATHATFAKLWVENIVNIAITIISQFVLVCQKCVYIFINVIIC